MVSNSLEEVRKMMVGTQGAKLLIIGVGPSRSKSSSDMLHGQLLTMQNSPQLNCLDYGSWKLEAWMKLPPMVPCSRSRWPYVFKDGGLGNVYMTQTDILFDELLAVFGKTTDTSRYDR